MPQPGIMVNWGVWAGLAALIFLRAPVAGQTSLPQNTAQQIQLLQEEKFSRTAIQRKLDSQIIYALREQRRGFAVPGVASMKSSLALKRGAGVMVDIQGDVSPSLLDSIKKNGGDIISSFERYGAIRAQVTLVISGNARESP